MLPGLYLICYYVISCWIFPSISVEKSHSLAECVVMVPWHNKKDLVSKLANAEQQQVKKNRSNTIAKKNTSNQSNYVTLDYA